MYMLPRDNHCITPTPSCGTSSVVPAANPDWLNPVHDGPSFASSPLVSADSSSSSMAPMTTPAMEITATPNTSLEGFAQPGSVPGDVGLLYRRLGRHLSLPIQNFVPKRECPANDDSDSNDSDGDEEMRDAPRAKPKVRGKWKAVPPPLSSQEEDAKPMAAAAVVVSEVKQRNDTDDCKRAEMLTYEKAAAEWERSLLESPRLLPTPNGVKQLIDLGVPAHHCSVEDAVEDSENAKKAAPRTTRTSWTASSLARRLALERSQVHLRPPEWRHEVQDLVLCFVFFRGDGGGGGGGGGCGGGGGGDEGGRGGRGGGSGVHNPEHASTDVAPGGSGSRRFGSPHAVHHEPRRRQSEPVEHRRHDALVPSTAPLRFPLSWI